ncbi:hypothetical protein [Streptomyces sp. NPDC127098]|uniref:hypothetical protein n=1 Tax=Streptomyces sp. NPDC127098 TaxID=3347137 RepID=UPI0036637417
MAGTVLEWWARLEEGGDGRPTAFVFGTDGLCKASPMPRNGKRVYLVERLKLDARTMRRQSFSTAATKTHSRAVSRIFRRTSPADVPPQPRTESAHPLSIHTYHLGVLGNFPADVQDFLQRPFLRDDRRVVADHYYEDSVEFASQRLFALFCLSADRNVTLATGTRILPRGKPLDHAQWQIECYHSLVRTPSQPQ